jgi:FtsH-binding integral membrane protein
MSNYLLDGYHHEPAALAPVNERVSFIRRTYAHLAVSVLALVGLEAVLLQALQTNGGKAALAAWFSNPISLLLVIGLFIAGGFLARYMARAAMPPAVKYLGLALYTGLEAVFLLPILYFATVKFGQERGMAMITQAGVLTLVTFGGLSLTVFLTKKDFSFLGYGLMLGSWLLFGIVLVAIIMPLFGGPAIGLGLWYSFAVIALAAGYILYDTSNILHHYGTDEHVGASLELLADVVLLFYHILRIFLLSRDE